MHFMLYFMGYPRRWLILDFNCSSWGMFIYYVKNLSFHIAQKSFASAAAVTVGQSAFFKSNMNADSLKLLKFRDSITLGLPLGMQSFEWRK